MNHIEKINKFCKHNNNFYCYNCHKQIYKDNDMDDYIRYTEDGEKVLLCSVKCLDEFYIDNSAVTDVNKVLVILTLEQRVSKHRHVLGTETLIHSEFTYHLFPSSRQYRDELRHLSRRKGTVIVFKSLKKVDEARCYDLKYQTDLHPSCYKNKMMVCGKCQQLIDILNDDHVVLKSYSYCNKCTGEDMIPNGDVDLEDNDSGGEYSDSKYGLLKGW